ncbi:MAG TPA: signal peptide peptidase SppA, partial [Polyangia bacterium]|nr:signal peptide peptidase SppA [Polyangia bacterium]
ALGAGVQLLRPPVDFPFGNEQKLDLALAVRLFPSLALGLHYAHLWADQGAVAQGIDTLDVALTLRPARWISAALVLHDLPSPAVAQFPLQRVWEPEIALRPFSTNVVELAIAARIGERREDIDPHFRLWVTPTAGVTLKCDLEWKRYIDLDAAPVNDIRVALGVAIDLEHIGAQVFGLFGRDQGVTRAHGFTVAMRISGDRYPTFWPGPTHLERIELSGALGDRKLALLTSWMRRLERDREVAGLVVVIGDVGGSWATAEELRESFARLRRAGKHVFAYVGETTTRGYYVASAAERVYQDPAGGIRLVGLSSTSLFFRGLGDMLGVHADFVKIAEYKSAPEQYTRDSPSEPAKLEREAFVSETYAHLVNGIAESRNVKPDKVRDWINKGPYTAVDAKSAGLVDELRHGDEVEEAITQALGRHYNLRTPPTTLERDHDWERPAVAVLFVDGDIVDGKSAYIPFVDMHLSGMQTLLAALQRARDDAQVKAIVVRIDSPGGSALASDVLARELERTATVKPVICSLGDVAASGGYFIASACSRIFAQPSTLTGSIGIFTGKFDVSGLAHKLGVSFESYERGTHAAMDSMWRLYTDEERALILEKLRYFYGRFLAQVARGRKLTTGEVDAVGRGHIWSGEAGRAHGLVDEYGGLMDAIAEAKQRAGLSDRARVKLQAMPDDTTVLSELLQLFGIGGERATTSGEDLVSRVLAPALRGIPGSLLLAPSTPQARADFDLVE